MSAPPPEAMRTRLLEAATRVFAARGYEGTSLQAVCDQVGIRKASLLYWFPSKEALREAVIDALLTGWKDVLPAVLLAASTGEDRFAGGLKVALDFFATSPDRARLLLRESLDRPDEMRATLNRHIGPWIGVVTAAIRRGQAEGRVRPDLDPEAWVMQVVLLVVGSFAVGEVVDLGLATGDEGTHARRAAEALRMARSSLFLDGAATRGG